MKKKKTGLQGFPKIMAKIFLLSSANIPSQKVSSVHPPFTGFTYFTQKYHLCKIHQYAKKRTPS